MANTVYGPFTATAITNGVTPINKTWGDNAQTQASVALNGINPLLSGPFIYSGLACTKDGTNANQLDIASGVAFITMSDGSTGQIVVGADNTHTTSTPSTTYYLFLKNDGTWQWGTTSTGPTNSLPICQATTDGSGNILAVTDVRQNAGSPGIPIVMARSLRQLVNTTAETPIASFSVPVTALYRANLYFAYTNPTPQKVIVKTNCLDPDFGSANISYFTAMNAVAPGMILNGSQASTTGNNQAVSCAPLVMFASALGFCSVHFQDPGGTPASHVTCVIERIS